MNIAIIHEEAHAIPEEQFHSRYGFQKSEHERPRTPLELKQTLELMEGINGQFYQMCFQQKMATKNHAFLEFSGVLKNYIDMCRALAEQNIDFACTSSEMQSMLGPTAPSLRMNVDQAKYLAGKLRCIFGTAFSADPEVAAVVREELGL